MKFCECLIHLLIIFLGQANCAKVLAVIHGPSYSHYSLGVKYLRSLAEKGHYVTMVSPYTLPAPPKTWRDVVLTDYLQVFEQGEEDILSFGKITGYQKAISAGFFGFELIKLVLKHPAVTQLLNSNESFDLIVIEKFLNEAMLGIAHRFNAPYILLCSTAYSRWTNNVVGNPGSPAYIPDIFLHYGKGMTLWQRFHNTFFYCYVKLIDQFTLSKHEKLYMETFPEAPPLEDVYHNASLIFVNSHLSVRYAMPTVPNLIDIGGFHVSPSKPLPQHLKEYMDNAPDGVIFFSLGSMFKSKNLPEEIMVAIVRVFSKLKQRILWKWEDDAKFPVPSNVRLEKWFPQQDLLAHPNLKLFITHGGLLSNIEAVHYGVPLLTIPIFAEQFWNAAEVESLEYGLQLRLADFSEDRFSSLINELLTNEKYRENIKMRSKVYHDRELKPIDRAVWWTEYVIRHKGAPHLKSVTLNLKWYQYILLDVFALGTLMVLFVVMSVSILLKRICRKGGKAKNE